MNPDLVDKTIFFSHDEKNYFNFFQFKNYSKGLDSLTAVVKDSNLKIKNIFFHKEKHKTCITDATQEKLINSLTCSKCN